MCLYFTYELNKSYCYESILYIQNIEETSDHFLVGDLSTCTAWIILATSTLVFPFTGFPFTPVISSPAASVPSRAAGVLSKTCNKKPRLNGTNNTEPLDVLTFDTSQKCSNKLMCTYLDNVETRAVLGSPPDADPNQVISIFLQTHRAWYCWYPPVEENMHWELIRVLHSNKYKFIVQMFIHIYFSNERKRVWWYHVSKCLD